MLPSFIEPGDVSSVPDYVSEAMTTAELSELLILWDIGVGASVLANPVNQTTLTERTAQMLKGKPARVLAWAAMNTP